MSSITTSRSPTCYRRLSAAGFTVDAHQYTYGIVETFTNNISYSITGADQQRKLLYAAAFPILLAL